MRPIHLARIDTTRPALLLTRGLVVPLLNQITVAPITGTVRGIATEVAVGRANGLQHDCVISCDNIHTISVDDLGRHIGFLLPEQEAALTEAILAAFDLH